MIVSGTYFKLLFCISHLILNFSNALSSDIYLGDNQTISEVTRNSMCKICVGLKPTTVNPTSSPAPNTTWSPPIPAEIPSLEIPRTKRDDPETATLTSLGEFEKEQLI